MLNRFKEELNGILREKNIHLSSGIFEDALLQIAGVEKSELTELAQKKSKDAVKLDIDYRNPKSCSLLISNMKSSAKTKLCKLFAINPENHFEGEPLLVKKRCLSNVIKPKFVEWFNKLSSDDVNKYQLASLKGLEDDAVKHIVQYSEKLIVKLNKRRNTHGSLRSKESQLLDIVAQLRDVRNLLHAFDHYHQEIVKKAGMLNNLIKGGLKYKDADALLMHMKLYAAYNRQDSVLANKEIVPAIETLLKPYKVTESECDIIEDVLLLCAGIAAKPKQAIFEPSYYDPSRRVIRYTDFSLENAKKLTDFLRDYDKTVVLNSHHSVFFDDDIGGPCSLESASLSVPRKPKKPVEVQEISLDATAFLKNVLPLVKEELATKMPTDEFFKGYQKASESYFAENAAAETAATKSKKQIKRKKPSSSRVAPVSLEMVERQVKVASLIKSRDALFAALPTLASMPELPTIVEQKEDQPQPSSSLRDSRRSSLSVQSVAANAISGSIDTSEDMHESLTMSLSR